MNIKELKKIRDDIRKLSDDDFYDLRTREYALMVYSKELKSYLKSNPSDVWAFCQNVSANEFGHIGKEYPDEALIGYYNNNKEKINSKDLILLTNNISYFLIRELKFKEASEYLESVYNETDIDEDILYPLCYCYLETKNTDALKYINKLLELNPNNYEILLWETVALMQSTQYEKAITNLIHLKEKIELENNSKGEGGCTTDSYLEYIYGNLIYCYYRTGQLHLVKEIANIIEWKIENEDVYEMDYDWILDIAYIMGNYEEVVRIGEKMLDTYSSKGLLEYYSYALYKTKGLDKASEMIAAYLKKIFNEIIEEIEDGGIAEEEFGHGFIQNSIKDAQEILSIFKDATTTGIPPRLNIDDPIYYGHIEVCFLKECILHGH